MCTRIGDYVLDLKEFFDAGLFSGEVDIDVFENDFLNDFISLGKGKTVALRDIIKKQISFDRSLLVKDFNRFFYKFDEVNMHLPLRVGDYTDFYSSRYHAENVGRIFRGNEDPLTPNWLHMPIAYHGRSSSIVVSETDIKIPWGQIKKGDSLFFEQSNKLDFELELGTVIGKYSQFGERIEVDHAGEYIFGFCMLNDWSARDIQSWEYRPLGPFLGKNFATSISPWIITLEALEPFIVKAQEQEKVLEYLNDSKLSTYDIKFSAFVNGVEVTETNFSKMYWTVNQQIAHHTVGGCNLRVGDLLGSGTISDEKGKGCLLEICKDGREPININGENQSYLKINDEVVFRGKCEKEGVRLGFGEVKGIIIS